MQCNGSIARRVAPVSRAARRFVLRGLQYEYENSIDCTAHSFVMCLSYIAERRACVDFGLFASSMAKRPIDLNFSSIRSYAISHITSNESRAPTLRVLLFCNVCNLRSKMPYLAMPFGRQPHILQVHSNQFSSMQCSNQKYCSAVDADLK